MLSGKDYRGPMEVTIAAATFWVEFSFTGTALGVSLGAVMSAVRSGQPTRPAEAVAGALLNA